MAEKKKTSHRSTKAEREAAAEREARAAEAAAEERRERFPTLIDPVSTAQQGE